MSRDTVVHFNDLVEGFRKLGASPGEIMMSHSSLSAFGWVAGGADTVIDAIIEALSPGGTAVFPALAQQDLDRRFELWDIDETPSDVGRITEVARLREESIRSDHPTHSVVAIGPDAEAITGGHAGADGRPGPWGAAAFGHGSPWEQFYQRNVLYCFLGVTFRVNTMRHYIQSRLCEQILQKTDDPSAVQQLQGWQSEGVWPRYDGEAMQRRLDRMGLITTVQIGKAECYSIRAKPMVDTALEILRKEPEKWFKPGFLKWYCRYSDTIEER